MSGHSKFANIKHKKAKGDAAKAKIFTKIGREIAVAVKQGGADPQLNAKLYDVMQKARQNNMPNDNVKNAIKKASGEIGGANYENLLYEGYGVGGTAVIVECLTDNKNRTAGEVRCAFDKYGGSMGSNGCVSYMFDRKGLIVLEKTISFDDIMELAIEGGADDVTDEEECFEVLCDPSEFSSLTKFFEANSCVILQSSIEWLPQNTVELEEKLMPTFEKMIDKLEESDDVQNVYHNCSNFGGEEEEE
ncbi:MAG: YebC/PmpR family DNA-binding transcriptional regulator [Bacillota bacterium]